MAFGNSHQSREPIIHCNSPRIQWSREVPQSALRSAHNRAGVRRYFHPQNIFTLGSKYRNDIIQPTQFSVWPRGQNIVWYFDSNNRWKFLFAFHIYFIRFIIILTSYMMITWLVTILLFWHYQELFQLDHATPTPPPPPPPHPSDNQWQSFLCLSCLLKKMHYYINILMIYWVFIMIHFAQPACAFTKL